MTPESHDSKWVQREIALADELDKPMFALLASGDRKKINWTKWLNIQIEDVRPMTLPRPEFFRDLGEKVMRNSNGYGRDITDTGKIPVVDLSNDILRREVNDPPAYDEFNDEPVKFLNSKNIWRIIISLLIISPLIMVIYSNLYPLNFQDKLTLTPTFSQTMVVTSTSNLDTLAMPASIETLNQWQIENGYESLRSDNVLNELADEHMRYIALLPLDKLLTTDLYTNEDGRDIQWMADEKNYGGVVQMFIEADINVDSTLRNLITRIRRQGNGEIVHSKYSDAGFSTSTSPVTQYTYQVLILGQRTTD